MTKDIEFLYLNRSDVIATGIDMQTAIAAVEDAFILHHEGKVLLPFKTVLDMGEREHGRCNAMPAYVGGDYHVFGVKWIAGFPKNPFVHNIPRATGFLILNDADKGIPLAIMDCTLLSAMRTGAVTGVGAKYLARKDSEIVAIIGAGVQARTQFEALMTVLPDLNELRSFDIRLDAAETFAEEMSKKFGINARAVASAEEAVRGADVIVTVTMADEPIVKDAWIKPGSFFAAVGSYQEEEFEVVSNSDMVVVDSIEHVLHRETPVVALMLKDGKLKEDQIVDLGAILCGEKPKRETPHQRVFFSPIGMGTEDICLTKKVYDLAVEKSVGQKLTLWGLS